MPLNKKDNQREDIAYIAGLIDGEGTIAIRKHNITPSQKHLKYQPYISMVNTDIRLVEKVAEFIGAKKISVHKPTSSSFQERKPCYKVMIVGTIKPLEPLKKLLPYLIAKRENAELAIIFCENVKRNFPKEGYKPTFTRISKKEAQWREEMYQKYLSIAHPQRLNEKTPKGETTV